ncbi:MAG: hypothetical protein ABI678_10965 [Kofleriaceae bacterium]
MAVGAACALFGCVESDPDSQDGLIAELERPTADGTAYTFRFSVTDGVVAKEVFTPAGHSPPVDDECALDTFLRVAADDAVVPMELRRSCATHDLPALGEHATVAELRPSGLTFQIAAASGPACTESAYNARYNALVTAASYVRTISVQTGFDCYIWYSLGPFGQCIAWDANGTTVLCNAAQIPDDGPPGCLVWHDLYSPEPDPDCEHNITSWGAFNPAWADWQVTTPTSTVSAARFEVSACGSSDQSAASWQSRRHTTDAWNTLHVTVWNGIGLYQIVLDSGTSSGNWSGNQFQFKTHGTAVRPMFAGARMQGLDRGQCASHLL